MPRGGPDGGDGGDGGSVVLIGDRGLTTLLDAKHHAHCRASRGVHGKGARKNGRKGEDYELRVPLGTIARDRESGELVCEVLEHGQREVVAQGGRGGRGNACFATSTNQAPLYAEPGSSGESRWLELELKVMADVGLIGFPNAGKSTLISAVSKARPRVADYPFTTLQPHLGMVEYQDTRFVMADIPGLIPGAHEGAGLGDRFLRHIERTRVFVHLLDPEPMLLETEERNLLDDYRAIRHELESYDRGLAARPELVLVSKCDLLPEEERREFASSLITSLEREHALEVRFVSAATGEGVRELVQVLAAALERARTSEAELDA